MFIVLHASDVCSKASAYRSLQPLMAESLHIDTGANRPKAWQNLLPQIEALVAGEPDIIANVSNIMSAIHSTFGFHWVGIYFVRGEQLVLGPFQGPIACTRIGFGKGVCGTAWKEKAAIIVDDVDSFPGHIACSALSKSEIVCPIFNAAGEVAAIIDIDSSELADFSQTDREALESVAQIIAGFL